MRLDRFLCEATGLTRSLAKKALSRGEITVNGEVVKKGDIKIDEQLVCLEGRLLSLRPPRYIMLHKPQGYISASQDDVHPCVLQLLPAELAAGLQCAGRLDLDTTGLLLLTDDGQWSHRLRSPRRACHKTYRVDLAEPLAAGTIERFAEGVLLHGEDKATLPATLDMLTPTQVLLTIQEGKYHQVKRMFAAAGNRVTALHRLQIGDILLDDTLAEGAWRHLTPEEVASIQ
ncbi:16S rRNA pseudouridine(516) synthase RsuA [Oceanimonas sp. CHS3-5]|uniref:16S rRNA pseudouridine(516) synthase RsuA n=1 Tax=Oceanimonas sp. CHS3-5 TaxID=3068186 RepID=UPI00273E8DBC|nr:16S rRNA pseudouridine(516) synthase RsuA [Oceanimonas sp. CHS3-5]MDP5292942.1 16S rRNA pseudouridine(516) synthase RsuA [Oceanimonas sp. CHS3-5]